MYKKFTYERLSLKYCLISLKLRWLATFLVPFVLSLEQTDSDNGDDKESNEPDYDEDKDQLEEEQQEEAGEITTN